MSRHQGVFVGLLVVCFSIVPGPAAYAHTLGDDSIDGSQIRWEDYTKWDSARVNAITDWNNVGCITMAADTWTSITDLEFRDFDDSNTSTTGYWQPRVGADRIYMNDYWMNLNTTAQKNHNMLHEVGHAVGLAHNTRSDSVMKQGRLNFNDLGAHDISDHRAMFC
jgi:hypothetical protein